VAPLGLLLPTTYSAALALRCSDAGAMTKVGVLCALLRLWALLSVEGGCRTRDSVFEVLYWGGMFPAVLSGAAGCSRPISHGRLAGYRGNHLLSARLLAVLGPGPSRSCLASGLFT